MSDNPTKIHKDFVRDNLPSGMSYDTTTNRYRVNDHSFFNYKSSYWYYVYISKYEFTTTGVPTLPNLSVAYSAANRLVTLTPTVVGTPTPTLSLGSFTLGGADVSSDVSGTGPWTYAVPSSEDAQTVAWSVTATNSAGTDTETGSETVLADLFSGTFSWTSGSINESTPEVGDNLSITFGVVTPEITDANVSYTGRYRIFRSGGTVQEINANYTVVEEDAGSRIIAEWRGIESGNNNNTNWQVVLDTTISSGVAAPTTSGSLANQSFTNNTGNQTFDASTVFSNDVDTFSLTSAPTGVTINSTTGVITFDTDTLLVQSDTAITVLGTNAGGSSNAGFSLTVSSATVAPTLSTAGTFSSPVTVGQPVTLTEATFTGTPTPTVSITALSMDGANVLNDLNGLTLSGSSVTSGVLSVTYTATNSAGSATSTSTVTIGSVVETGDVFFGAQTPVGKGGTTLVAPNGDYGEFTVTNNIVTPRVSPLTTSETINGVEVTVRPGNVRTVSGYAELVEARNSGLRGYTFELQPGNYDMRPYTSATARLEPKLTPVTFKSANPDNRAVLTGWETHLYNTYTRQGDPAVDVLDVGLDADGFAYTLKDLDFVNPRPILSKTSFAINGDASVIRRVDDIGAPSTNVVDFKDIAKGAVVNCNIDGSLPHSKDGGRAFYLLNGFRYGTDCSLIDTNIINVESGIDVNADNAEMVGGSIKGVHGDFISTSSGVSGLKCHHVHFESPAADAGYRHPDIAQANGKTGSVRGVDFLGCTASFGNRGEVSQDRVFPPSKPIEHVYTNSSTVANQRIADNKGEFTTLLTGNSLTVTDFNAFRDNRFVIETGTSVEIILPSAAASNQRTYTFQHASNDATNYGGQVTFTLNGSDTHVCGTIAPSTGNLEQGRSFVSNGTSEWQMLEVGRGRFDYIVRENVTLDTFHAWKTKVTISTGVEDSMYPNFNTATQDRVVTIPAGFVDTSRVANDQNAAYYLSRIFPHTGTVTIQFSNGEQVSVEGASAASSFTMAPGSGYVVRWNGTGWDAERGAPSLQGMFTNNAWEGQVRGCIFLAHGGNHFWPEIEAFNEGMKLYNNVFLSYPIENHPASPAQANTRLNSSIDKGQRNLVGTTFQVNNGAQVSGNMQLGIVTGGSTSPLLPLVAASTEAELRAQSRDEVLQYYRAQASSALDTGGIGAVGATDNSGFYNPTTKTVNASYGAPVLTSSLPNDGGSYPANGVIQLSFDQFITKGTGDVIIYDVTNSTTLQTIPISDSQFVVNGTTLVFTPTTALTAGITAEIRMGSGVVMPLLYSAPHAGIAAGDLRWTTQALGQSVFETVDNNQAYLKRSGAISTKTGVTKALFAFQLDRLASPSGRYDLLNMSQGSSARSRIEMIGTTLDFNGWAAGNIGFSAPSAIPTNGTSPQLLVISVDTTQANFADGVKAYLNDTALTLTNAGWVQNATFNATDINSTELLALSSLSRVYEGLIDFAYVSFPTSLPDISQQSVRDDFQFLNMGSDGSGPTGEVPELYIRNLADWNNGTNSGSGGDFVTTGTFTSV